MEKKNALPARSLSRSSARMGDHSLRKRAGFRLAAMLLIFSATLVVQPALAGGGGANLYVATTGVDSGNCLVSPCRTIAYAMDQASSYDNIRIAAGTYYENLVMNENLDFYGAGMTATILDGGNTDPVIYDGSYDLLLMDMTIRNGYYPTGSGGGISNWGGALHMTRVKVTGNVAHFGGGVFSNGLLNMTDCMISGNQAVTYDTTDGYGGGIFLQSSNTANLNNVTIYGNTASGSSGGLHNQRNGAVNLTNVTITNNLADANGALSTTNSSTLTILNSTIVYNYFHSGGSNGGIGNYATTNFKNTIVAANQGTNCFNSGSGSLVTQGGNLDSGNTCGFNHPSDYRNTDPLLGPPADNGGYTLTHALLLDSPAIDSGTNTGCPATDQRGVARPQDGNLNGSATCDIGAYEASAPDGVATYRRATGGAYWLNYNYSTGTYTNYLSLGDGGTTATCYPAPMDFDGDGVDEPTHLCGGGWHFYESNGAFVKSIFAYMQVGDIPVPGDYDGDGDDEVAVYRRTTGGAYWFFYNYSTGAYTNYISIGDGGSSATCYPAAMDFDGDGSDELTHLCGGGWHFFETNGTFVKSIFAYMQAGDQPAPGDYDGDGTDEVAVYRRATSGAYWLFYDFAASSFTNYLSLGDGGSSATCYPAVMDFDGDGFEELTHLCGGGWHFFETDGSFVKSIFAYMQVGDKPVPGKYHY